VHTTLRRESKGEALVDLAYTDSISRNTSPARCCGGVSQWCSVPRRPDSERMGMDTDAVGLVRDCGGRNYGWTVRLLRTLRGGGWWNLIDVTSGE